MAKIYHYTSIETLALILKSKKIRFNRLDQVDDMEESCYASGNVNFYLGQYCFVSCWTKENRENLSLWKMYTNYKGVRIGLDENMFMTYKVLGEHESFFDSPMELLGDCVVTVFNNDTRLHDVEYIPDLESKIKELVNIPGGNKMNIQIQQIGLYKRKEWECQKESRFKIIALPFNKKIGIKNTATNFDVLCGIIESIGLSTTTNAPISIKNIDIPLNVEKLSDMELMLGPQTSEGEKEVVRQLLKDYPNVKIQNSYFDGKIREK